MTPNQPGAHPIMRGSPATKALIPVQHPRAQELEPGMQTHVHHTMSTYTPHSSSSCSAILQPAKGALDLHPRDASAEGKVQEDVRTVPTPYRVALVQTEAAHRAKKGERDAGARQREGKQPYAHGRSCAHTIHGACGVKGCYRYG